MAVNDTEPRFEAPIPGMSMTHELGARPWQTPPKYATVEEALEYYLPRMQDNSFTDSLINVIEMGMPLTTLANTIQLAGVMEGRHSVDVGILIMPVLIEMMQLVAEAEGIEYVTGMERDIKSETKDSDVSAALATLKDDLINEDTDKPQIKNMDIVEEQDEPSLGLMARRG
tara:strand:- start:4371 stop:4883 length:513 start_codon:yes stop_codon:yes gene_type:complete